MRSRLIAAYGPATVRLTCCAIKGVLATAAKLSIISYDELRRRTDWPRLRGFRLPAGRALDDPEIDEVLGWCSSQPAPFGVFSRAALAILFRCGLRREELATLPQDAYADIRALKAHRHLRGEFVFCAEGGQHLTHDACKWPLWAACKRAGVGIRGRRLARRASRRP